MQRSRFSQPKRVRNFRNFLIAVKAVGGKGSIPRSPPVTLTKTKIKRKTAAFHVR